MNRIRSFRVLAPLVLLALCTSTRAQDAGFEPAKPLELSLGELVLEQYPVKNVSSEELFTIVQGLVGRTYFVKENGSSNRQASMRRLGGTIVIYDTKEQVQRARELLVKLDVTGRESSTAWEAVEYKPRFISVDAVLGAVSSMFSSVSRVEKRGLVVLHGERATIETALALLKRIDVPERQVLLSCQLIEVGGSPQGPALPRELGDNLQKLLPESTFTPVGLAMLKTSVNAQSPVSVQIESTGKRYLFAFLPVAFDEATSSLTVSDCRLVEQADSGARELFSTSTVLRGGEYTVLAATGATPRLLVVRVTPQG